MLHAPMRASSVRLPSEHVVSLLPVSSRSAHRCCVRSDIAMADKVRPLQYRATCTAPCESHHDFLRVRGRRKTGEVTRIMDRGTSSIQTILQTGGLLKTCNKLTSS